MPQSPAERLVFLNHQAIAILRLKIPLDLGLGANTPEQLRDINDRLFADVGSGRSVDELLQRHQFPPRYETISRMLLASDDPAPIFESIAMQNLECEAATIPFRKALAEPLVVAGLAYLGMVLLCVNTIPHIEAQYIQQGEAPSGATSVLIAVRETMPYWIVALPLLFLAGWWFCNKLSRGRLIGLLPGVRPYSRWLAAESQSSRLAVMIGSGVDEGTALSLAAESVSPRVPIRPIAESIVRNGDRQTRPRALRRLSLFYRFLAEDRRQTYFSNVPMLAGLFFAGLVVLGYALATFLPWIEILNNLTAPRNV